MTGFCEPDRQQLLTILIQAIHKRSKCGDITSLILLAEKLYKIADIETLRAKGIKTLVHIASSLKEWIDQRKPGETKIRLFNPSEKHNGFGSEYTVIQISHDNMPFLIDSIQLVLQQFGVQVHCLFYTGGIAIERDKKHRLLRILPSAETSDTYATEAPIYIEIDRLSKASSQKALQRKIKQTLQQVTAVTQDWRAMRMATLEALEVFAIESVEAKAFLSWLLDNKFTFLGCCDYVLSRRHHPQDLVSEPNSGLGLLRHLKQRFPVSSTPCKTHELSFSKSSELSPIHQLAYFDEISIPRFDTEKKYVGERRLIGLYTSEAYHMSAKHIPLIREKAQWVLAHSGLSINSYAGKTLRDILESLPREDLLLAPSDELLKLSLEIFHLQEKQQVRCFIRKDTQEQFFSCLVYIPSHTFRMEWLNKIWQLLKEKLKGDSVTFSTSFSKKGFVQLHFIIRVAASVTKKLVFNAAALERDIILLTRVWEDELRSVLLRQYGEKIGNNHFNTYRSAFPLSYQEAFSANNAQADIEKITCLFSQETAMQFALYAPIHQKHPNALHAKLFQREQVIPLSELLPKLENMGLRVIEEHVYEVTLPAQKNAWIHAVKCLPTYPIALPKEWLENHIQQAFLAIWTEEVENDGLNALVLAAGLTIREIVILRAYAKYWQQLGCIYSLPLIAEALLRNISLTQNLIKYFSARFSPENKHASADSATLKKNQASKHKTHLTIDFFTQPLEQVERLDDERILRRYIEFIQATLRTNYFQKKSNGQPKNYLSFKFDPSKISAIPLPIPQYEIFVYSPRFEGVHLRAGKIARGGIRWSDRLDFRTEVLGLMKAQRVKNAVIIPTGAKGGFFPKQLFLHKTREAQLQEAIACYQDFIRGLLDLTDNLRQKKIIPPPRTKRYDGDDFYLVVAADKGTASFSDIANALSKEYDFWLDDAFASGGSYGYDHKKMGITARGAWESVKRHFQEMGKNIQSEDFSVVGIGDMAGDVFGNGMLLSKHIKLIAAFNHQHIFIDPNPNPEISFNERQRLFNLPRSNWTDYAKNKISTGGGVFERSAKYIILSKEIKQKFKLTQDRIEPNELIRLLLTSEFDLLWNGGIGTFIKASYEKQEAAGDANNNAIRVDANALRCKAIGEGGNLGLTQLARIEYALSGGSIYTDFIDNSGGVDCSDHEVNLKILFYDLIHQKKLDLINRNKLLAQKTEEIAELVLNNNIQQINAIEKAYQEAAQKADFYSRLIRHLEQHAELNRTLEYLPSDSELQDRKAIKQGLTRPELAILLAYTKIWLKTEILNSIMLSHAQTERFLKFAFPPSLPKAILQALPSHPLKKEMVATMMVNHLVAEKGLAFVLAQQEKTGEAIPEIIFKALA